MRTVFFFDKCHGLPSGSVSAGWLTEIGVTRVARLDRPAGKSQFRLAPVISPSSLKNPRFRSLLIPQFTGTL